MFVKRCARERSFFLNLLVTRALIGIFIKYSFLPPRYGAVRQDTAG